MSDVSTKLTDKPVTLEFYLESNFVGQMQPLMDAFTEQYPNVSFEVKSDEFTNLMQNAQKIMSSPDGPDLMRFPTVATAARNGIILNLDPYAEAYDWTDWPEGLLSQVKVDEDGNRGSGSLYSLGIGYSVTGVYYNKDLAEQVGMTEPPATIEELEQLMAEAKSQDILPIMQWNKEGGIAFPFQALLNQSGDVDQLRDWLNTMPAATFDQPGSVQAAKDIQEWADAGYFPDDVNAVDYPTAMGRFIDGEGLFMFNGDWESTNLEKSTNGNTGFFLMPGTESTSQHVAMAAPATFVVPKTSDHPDEVAFFLNWVHTDPEARQLVLEATGQHPGGPADLPVPEAPAGSLQEETLAASSQLAAEDGAIDFIANATAGILATGVAPNLQLLVTDRTTPQELVEAIQKAYEAELGR